MAIEEKRKELEFSYTLPTGDGSSSLSLFEVLYKEMGSNLEVTWGPNPEQKMDFPVDFFVETVDFLRSKGVIKPDVLTRGLPATNVISSGNILPIPEITSQGIPEATSNAVPVTSFDVNQESTEPTKLEPPVIEKTQGPVIGKPEGPVIDNSTPVDGNSDMPKRPVIRSRVTNADDPLAAEREAAILRGQSESNFRRKDE